MKEIRPDSNGLNNLDSLRAKTEFEYTKLVYATANNQELASQSWLVALSDLLSSSIKKFSFGPVEIVTSNGDEFLGSVYESSRQSKTIQGKISKQPSVETKELLAYMNNSSEATYINWTYDGPYEGGIIKSATVKAARVLKVDEEGSLRDYDVMHLSKKINREFIIQELETGNMGPYPQWSSGLEKVLIANNDTYMDIFSSSWGVSCLDQIGYKEVAEIIGTLEEFSYDLIDCERSKCDDRQNIAAFLSSMYLTN